MRVRLKALAIAGALAATLVLAGCATTTTVAGRPAATSMPAPASTSSAAVAVAPPAAVVTSSPAKPKAKPKPNPCATNTAAQYILVVISVQHAWMCSHTTLVYNTAVTTGATVNGDDTPTGTWNIQSVQGPRYLTLLNGTQYHVDHWLPYDGVYGFHDAAWQTFPEGSAQYHTDGSHGCVHLPMKAMTWLASWAHVGATVTIRPA